MFDHTETIQLDYDPARVSYAELLDVFWEHHSPNHPAHSRQYMSAIFCADDAQRRIATESRDQCAARRKQQLYTRIAPLEAFYRAEDYHQKYYLRRHGDLMGAFSGYPERRFEDSTVAARLNGYIAGAGTRARLAAEEDGFGLPERARDRLRKLVERAEG